MQVPYTVFETLTLGGRRTGPFISSPCLWTWGDGAHSYMVELETAWAILPSANP